MTDRRSTREPDCELEGQLRDHYRTMESGSGPLLAARVADALDRRPAPGSRLRILTGRRAFAGALAAMAALMLIALSLSPLLLGSKSPAGPDASASRPPNGSAALSGAPSAGGSVVPMPMPPPDPSAVLAGALTSGFGSVRSGGAWWVQGNGFWVATDPMHASGNSPWPGSDTVPPAVFVLDQKHGWTVTLGSGSLNPYGGQGQDFDHLKAVVNRTTDGGLTWQQAQVPGDYPDSLLTLSFVDQLHGFLMCSGSSPEMTSTILRTDDGGATWTVVATVGPVPPGANPGGMFTASDASTLWAGAQVEAVGHGHPLLAVSRDAGRTWSDVPLPGNEGLAGGFDVFMEEAPVFLDANTGFVNVLNSRGETFSDVFITTDGGRTWTGQHVPFDARHVDFLDTSHWLAPGNSSVAVTADGGKTWKTVLDQTIGIGAFVQLEFLNPQNGYGIFEPNGERGHYYLYRTDSGGADWVLVSSV
jgi:photosystem II stability/assembly factor-like uncharacterized protein